MSCNAYRPHLLVLPEDDANRQVANGFLLDPNLNNRAVQVLNVADGWTKVLDKFENDYLADIRKFPERRMVLLLDFDDDVEERSTIIKNKIPDDIKNRVFVLGVQSEPEKLRAATRKSFEEIGEALAEECANNQNIFWSHDLLRHNQNELMRLISNVKPFLFNNA